MPRPKKTTTPSKKSAKPPGRPVAPPTPNTRTQNRRNAVTPPINVVVAPAEVPTLPHTSQGTHGPRNTAILAQDSTGNPGDNANGLLEQETMPGSTEGLTTDLLRHNERLIQDLATLQLQLAHNQASTAQEPGTSHFYVSIQLINHTNGLTHGNQILQTPTPLTPKLLLDFSHGPSETNTSQSEIIYSNKQ